MSYDSTIDLWCANNKTGDKTSFLVTGEWWKKVNYIYALWYGKRIHSYTVLKMYQRILYFNICQWIDINKPNPQPVFKLCMGLHLFIS